MGRELNDVARELAICELERVIRSAQSSIRRIAKNHPEVLLGLSEDARAVVDAISNTPVRRKATASRQQSRAKRQRSISARTPDAVAEATRIVSRVRDESIVVD